MSLWCALPGGTEMGQGIGERRKGLECTPPISCFWGKAGGKGGRSVGKGEHYGEDIQVGYGGASPKSAKMPAGGLA